MKKLAMLILSGALVLSLFALPGAAMGTSQTAPLAKESDLEAAIITVSGEKTELVYSLDYSQRIYHLVREYDASRELETLWGSLNLTARKANLKTAPKAGFLAHLQNGKKTVLYVDDKQAYDPDTGKLYKSSAVERSKLIALGKRCNGISAGTPMWIAYMSDDNITEITFDGTDLYLTSSWSGMSLNLTAKDNPEAVKEIARFLKRGGLAVASGKPYSGPNWDPTCTPNVGVLYIKFKSGASYYMQWGDYSLLFDTHGYGKANYKMDALPLTAFYIQMKDYCKRYGSITPVV